MREDTVRLRCVRIRIRGSEEDLEGGKRRRRLISMESRESATIYGRS